MLQPAERASLVAELTRDEGLRLYVYDDATGAAIKPGSRIAGHPTIGIGRCLDTSGLSASEASFLLADDIEAAERRLADALHWWNQLDPARQRVLIEMAFNLGVGGLLGFRGTLSLIQAGRYDLAAETMLQSRWAAQIGARAQRLAQLMRKGGQ